MLHPEVLLRRRVLPPRCRESLDVCRVALQVELAIVAAYPGGELAPDRAERRLQDPLNELITGRRQFVDVLLQQPGRTSWHREESPETVDLLIAEDLTVGLGRDRHNRTAAETCFDAPQAAETFVASAIACIRCELFPSKEGGKFVELVLWTSGSTQLAQETKAQYQGLEVPDRAADGRQVPNDATTKSGPDGHCAEGINRSFYLGT